MRRVSLFGLVSALSLAATAAFAAPATLSGSYSLSEQYPQTSCYGTSCGGPSLTYNLGSGGSFSQQLTAGVATAATNFFTASPAQYCAGAGCSYSNGAYTESDMLTVNFSGMQVSGYGTIADFSVTGLFTAKYSGSELGCAVGDGKSPSSGATDCMIWTGAANTYNGSISLTKQLSNGYSLAVFLYNATDWNITPKIAFELIDPPAAVPEPASLALVGAALAGLGFVRRRRVG